MATKNQEKCFDKLDLLYDIKTLHQAKKRLAEIPDEITSLNEEYEQIHLTLREGGFKMNEFPPSI